MGGNTIVIASSQVRDNWGEAFFIPKVQFIKKIKYKEKVMRRRFLLSLLVTLMAVMVVACSQEKKAELEDDNILRIGMEAGYPPFNWTQSDDSNGAIPIEGSPEFANGYDVQIARKIAEGLGKKLVAVKIEWYGLVPALTSGRIDLIMAGMSPTVERAKEIDFSDAYYNSDLVLVVNKNGSYKDATKLSDFSEANVVAQLNTFHDTVIEQIEGVNHLQPMSDFPAMRVAVQSGKADAYVAERPEAEAAQAAGINLKMISLDDGFETSLEDTAIAIGVVKGSNLTQKLNEILSQITEEERIKIMDEMNSIQAK